MSTDDTTQPLPAGPASAPRPEPVVLDKTAARAGATPADDADVAATRPLDLGGQPGHAPGHAPEPGLGADLGLGPAPAPAAPAPTPTPAAAGPADPSVTAREPRPGIRVGTVVWGFVIAVIGAGILAAVGGASIDVQLASIIVLACAGVAMLVGSLVNGARRQQH